MAYLYRYDRVDSPTGSILKLFSPHHATPLGDVYCLDIPPLGTKLWRYHRTHSTNLVILTGEACIYTRDKESSPDNTFHLDTVQNALLHIPPLELFSIRSLSNHNILLLNLSSSYHDPSEVVSLPHLQIPN